jgi:nucleotide-binding universal stress UspA family protein
MNPFLIGYDGSRDAAQAIAIAATLFPGARCVVATAWRPLVATLASYPMAAAAPLPNDVVDLDRDFRAGAERTAAEGAERAREAGLEPESLAVETDGPFWRALLEAADERDASAIVVGPRGLTGVKSMLLGSVSHGVLHNARRPVVVVPHSDGP